MMCHEPFADYQRKPAINASTLVHALKSWRQFNWVRRMGYRPKVSTVVGHTTHTLVESFPVDRFNELFAVMPDFKKHPDNVTAEDKPSTGRTSWVRQQEKDWAANEPRELITPSEAHRVRRMLQAIEAHREAAALIAASDREVSVYAELFGVPCKGRIDGLQGPTLWDLKTTRDVSAHSFGRDCANLRYVLRLSFYWMLCRELGRTIEEVKIIAAQDSRPLEDGTYNQPSECVIYTVPMIAIENQIDQIHRLLLGYKECLRTGEWPGVPDGPLEIPNWAMSEEELV